MGNFAENLNLGNRVRPPGFARNEQQRHLVMLCSNWLKVFGTGGFVNFYVGSYQWSKGNIFQRGQSHFSRFFPGVKCFCPVDISILVPKTNFSDFKKWKAKKKNK